MSDTNLDGEPAQDHYYSPFPQSFLPPTEVPPPDLTILCFPSPLLPFGCHGCDERSIRHSLHSFSIATKNSWCWPPGAHSTHQSLTPTSTFATFAFINQVLLQSFQFWLRQNWKLKINPYSRLLFSHHLRTVLCFYHISSYLKFTLIFFNIRVQAYQGYMFLKGLKLLIPFAFWVKNDVFGALGSMSNGSSVQSL